MTGSRGVGIFLAMLYAAASVACGGGGEGHEGRAAGDLPHLLRAGGAPLTMRVAPLRDTVDGRGDLRIAYLFANRGETVSLAISDASVGFQVIGPDGRTLKREAEEMLPETNLPVRRVEVAPNTFTGGVVNLACASRLDAPSVGGAAHPCLWRYRFPVDGAYRVVGHYAPVAEPGNPRSALRLVSDTAVVIVRKPKR